MVGKPFPNHAPCGRFRKGQLYYLESPAKNGRVEWFLVKFVRLSRIRIKRDWIPDTIIRYEYVFLRLAGSKRTRAQSTQQVYTRIEQSSMKRNFLVRKLDRNELALFLNHGNVTRHFEDELKGRLKVQTRIEQVCRRYNHYLATGDNRFGIKGLGPEDRKSRKFLLTRTRCQRTS